MKKLFLLPLFIGGIGFAQVYDSGDKVGIGTTSPSSKLHVAGNGAVIKLQNTTHEDTENAFYGWLGGYDKSGDEVWYVGEPTSGHKKIGLYTNRPGYQLQLLNNGNGITINDNGRLFQSTDATNDNSAGFVNLSTTGYGLYSKGGLNSKYAFHFENQAGTSIMLGNGNGNIGIGTTSPSAKLHIVDQGTSGVTTLQLNNKIKFRGDGVIEWGASSNQGLMSWGTGRAVIGAKSGQDLSLYANNSEKIRIKSDGNIGVGLDSPDYLFQIHNANTPTLAIGKLNENTNGQSKLAFFAGTSTHKNGYSIVYTKSNIADRLGFFDGSGAERVSFLNGGNVGIGTTDTQGFKLGVDGDIAALEVKIATYSNWPDYVFKDTYNLPALKDVAQHIEDNGHLKDIPSAEKVKEKGFFLGDMDAKLLQKIEELTLYTIEQQKELEAQSDEIEALKKENEELKSLSKRLAAVEALLNTQKQ